ncbi:hypothetical protein DENSPDRAFT_466423 [Dentipellis sp. KUC8613]|nr:hypothetical protein DENSPDRAFT_466423 [Dentipellis sp. KUC8613]
MSDEPSMSASPFLNMPFEVTEHTLTFCHPRDVSAFSQASRFTHSLVNTLCGQYLWRQLFLAYPFDDLRSSPVAAPDAVPDWRTELQRRVHAEYIAREGGDRYELLDVLLSALRRAAPVPPPSPSTPDSTLSPPAPPSANMQWVREQADHFAGLEEQAPHIGPPALAELRAHLALTHARGSGPSAPAHVKRARRVARSFVYDLRTCTEEREWGPFCDSATRVDWAHVNAIVTTIVMNLRDFGQHWPVEYQPRAVTDGLEASRAYSAPEVHKRPPEDWAGVTGHWMRIVCFCDYRDLIRFNAYGCREDFFDDDYEEASRLLRLKLHLESVESDPVVLAALPDRTRPPLTFAGTMRGFNSDEVLDRAVRGTVSVMPDGNVRWSFVSLYNSQEQWSSEGIQLGGVCSAAGIVGIWSGAFHDHGDPAGPFWFFKTHEKTNDALISRTGALFQTD